MAGLGGSLRGFWPSGGNARLNLRATNASRRFVLGPCPVVLLRGSRLRVLIWQSGGNPRLALWPPVSRVVSCWFVPLLQLQHHLSELWTDFAAVYRVASYPSLAAATPPSVGSSLYLFLSV